MKNILTLLTILLMTVTGVAQITTEREDKSPQRTKHERTTFYEKDGKTPCGRLVQYDTSLWHAYTRITTDGAVPRFDNRPEAVKWLKAYCPVEGKIEFKK